MFRKLYMLHDVKRKAVQWWYAVWYAVSVISAPLYENFVHFIKYGNF